MTKARIDRLDLRILQELQKNARITNVELASRVGLSPAPCLRRVKELEESGVIEQYLAVINERAMGLQVNAFIAVQLQSAAMPSLELFEAELRKLPEVVEAYVLAGDWDYLVRVLVTDLDAFEAFLRKHLSQIPGVARLRSSFALREVTRSRQISLEHGAPERAG